MPRLQWVGVFGACLLLGCGMTTRKSDGTDPREPRASEPEQDDSDEPTPSSGGNPAVEDSPTDEPSAEAPDTDEPDPAEEDTVGQLVQTLEFARYYRAVCLAERRVSVERSYLIGPFFLTDPSGAWDPFMLQKCLREHPDQEAIASLLACWFPMLEGAKTCWQTCPESPGENCWGPGCAPGMYCLDKQLLGELWECRDQGLQPQ